jgi:putative holliday junction resolvase
MHEFQFPSGHPLDMKTILAMDYGEKFIGLASYCVNRDPYPTPYGRIANQGLPQVIAELRKIVADECIDLIVIGLPFLTDGKETSMTVRARTYLDAIQKEFNLPVDAQDETLSTFEAQARMKSSPRYNFQVDYKQIDAVAASVILEDFIRRKRRESGL